MQFCTSDNIPALGSLLFRYGMTLEIVAPEMVIPGSFWGDSEAGLIANQLLVRSDTPVHSALHEACHYICMDKERRQGLHTDAGGGYDEENGVCYLQILLSNQMLGYGQEAMFKEMDAWGYSFRLGSAQAWFCEDAEDALAWLRNHGLVDAKGMPTWRLRDDHRSNLGLIF